MSNISMIINVSLGSKRKTQQDAGAWSMPPGRNKADSAGAQQSSNGCYDHETPISCGRSESSTQFICSVFKILEQNLGSWAFLKHLRPSSYPDSPSFP